MNAPLTFTVLLTLRSEGQLQEGVSAWDTRSLCTALGTWKGWGCWKGRGDEPQHCNQGELRTTWSGRDAPPGRAPRDAPRHACRSAGPQVAPIKAPPLSPLLAQLVDPRDDRTLQSLRATGGGSAAPPPRGAQQGPCAASPPEPRPLAPLDSCLRGSLFAEAPSAFLL